MNPFPSLTSDRRTEARRTRRRPLFEERAPMQAARLTMDSDYHDLAYFGRGSPEDLERLFDRMAEAGFAATTWDHFWCGTALYHSERFPVFTNAARWKSACALAEVLREWAPLACALRLGKERGIAVLPYFRLLKEAYAPFDGNKFFRSDPQYWWRSRCGLYRMVGWPCYSYPEVRAHMLERVDDLVEQGVEGALFDLARTHIPYFIPYRGEADAFGFNDPVVAESEAHYGANLAHYDILEDGASAGHSGLPFTYEFRWAGAQPYDPWLHRRLIGEGFDLFFREVRRRHPGFYIAVQAGLFEGGGGPEEMGQARCRIDSGRAVRRRGRGRVLHLPQLPQRTVRLRRPPPAALRACSEERSPTDRLAQRFFRLRRRGRDESFPCRDRRLCGRLPFQPDRWGNHPRGRLPARKRLPGSGLEAVETVGGMKQSPTLFLLAALLVACPEGRAERSARFVIAGAGRVADGWVGSAGEGSFNDRVLRMRGEPWESYDRVLIRFDLRAIWSGCFGRLARVVLRLIASEAHSPASSLANGEPAAT
ncbi:MAG: hypothetical protein IT210_09040 [Armatimonadetes bacterium]|nr:hypothetical protein [Armatimonadota bacterium]